MTRKKLLKILTSTDEDISSYEIARIMKLVFGMSKKEVFLLLEKIVQAENE